MALLYIDPGTGSLLFSVFIGLAAALYFLFKNLLIKTKSIVFGKSKSLRDKNTFIIYNEAAHYWPVFSSVLEEFERRKINVLYLTSSEKDPAFTMNFIYVKPEYIGTGNKAFSVLNFIEADICLMTTPSLEVYQLKRSKLCKHYSHILHDTGDVTCYKLFGTDWFDSVLLTGEYQMDDIRQLEKSRSMPEKQLHVVGCTYLDYYSNKIKELSNNNDNVFTVLVSPSWGPGSLLNTMGEKLLGALEQSGWHIIVRPHPQSKITDPELLKNLETKYSAFIWDYNSENLESLSRADIMITDFSSIIFDYTFLFNKPVLYHNAGFKKEMYDAGDIQQEPWKFTAIKQFGVELSEKDLPLIKEIIQNAISNDTMAEERKKAKEIAWQNIGQSGNAVVDALIKIRENLK